MDRKVPEGGVGVDLFGEPVETPNGKGARQRAHDVNDKDLAVSVLRTALGDGYSVIGHPMRVYRCAARGEIDAVPRYESDMVSQLLDQEALRIGGWHDYTCGSSAGRGRAVLVPRATRTLLNRWASLKGLSGYRGGA